MTQVQVVFIDSALENSALLANSAADALEVHLLDASTDGLAQVAAILAGRTGLGALHFVSHGAPGVLALGSTRLDLAGLDEHAASLAAIGATLAPGGDLLLYGCDIAAGSEGTAFVRALAASTGADVAASSDLTATAFVGGNWQLEVGTGPIGAAPLANLLDGYAGTLSLGGGGSTPANTAPTFGTADGIVVTPVGTSNAVLSGMALQADGNIIAVGYAFNGSPWTDIAVVRYRPDGRLDQSFGNIGRAIISLSAGNDDGRGMMLQPDGKIVIAGITSPVVVDDFGLIRVDTSGNLDPTFGSGGKVGTDFTGAGSYDDARGAVLQTDGRIVVAGVNSSDANWNFAAARYNGDGSLDSSFDGDGKVTTDIGLGHDAANALALQANGKLVLAGFASDANDKDFALVRYNLDGSLDNTFDGDGRVLTQLGSVDDEASSVLIQPDQKILVAGASRNQVARYEITLVRYNPDGSLDSGFGNAGVVHVANDSISAASKASALALQADGKILVAGTSNIDATPEFALIRLNTDGSMDTGFGIGGKVRTATGTLADTAAALLVQPDGRIVLGGSSYNTASNFALVRYNADGSLDASFDHNGTQNYVENGTPVPLAPDAHIFDKELAASGHYNGASLTIARHGGANAQDVFTGSGSLAALVEGGDLKVGTNVIGSVLTNGGGTLMLRFGFGSTQLLVDSALRQIAYSNGAAAPPAEVRIDWTFSDMNQGFQGPGGALSAVDGGTVRIAPTSGTFHFGALADGTIFSFDPALENLVFDDPYLSASELRLQSAADGTQVSLSAAGKTIRFAADMPMYALGPDNLQFADGSVLQIGDAAANILIGTNSRDYLDGLGGADTMRGGAGGDTYVVDNAGDVVDENWLQQVDLIGVSNNGVQGNLGSADPSISANGRFVAFSSDATNLVSGDTNQTSDIFLKDTVTGEVRRVSADANGAQVTGYSYGTALSADGQLVAFTSTGAGLVPGGTSGTPAVYVKNMLTGAVQRASTDAAGIAANAGSSSASLSADGRYVLFESAATNLVGSDGNGASDVFVKDLQTGAIVRASTSAAGVEGNLASSSAKFTPDGRYVVFASSANNLVANDNNGHADIFVKDLQTGAIQRASVGATGTEGPAASAAPSISADGRYVAFESTAAFVAGDTNGLSDIYVKDLLTGAVVLASTNYFGQPATSGASRGAVLSADGAYVAFESSGSQIISFDSNQTVDVFVRSLQAGTTQRVPTIGNGLQTPYPGSTVPALAAFSSDGSYLVFQSRNPNLFSGDANGSPDVYRVANPFLLQASPAGIGDQVLSSVTFTLPANVEDLVLTGTSAINGTGNTLANRIVGNDADNVLYGGGGGGGMGGGASANDTLIGGGGNDTLNPSPSPASMLYGGSGDDSYFVFGSGNTVVEDPGEGTDSILVEYLGNYVAPENIENISLEPAFSQGGGNLAGNALDNIVTGSIGPNRIDGGAGADTLVGGGDADTYVVDNPGDVINETADTAIDTVEASMSRTLESTIENLVLVGSAPIDATGNELSNRVTGNSAANHLYGGGGSDRLVGNGGNDTLDGGAAFDWMAGGSGDDTYTIDTRLPGYALAFTGEADEYITAGLTHYYTGTDGTFDALTLYDMNSDGQIDQLTIRFLSPGLAHVWNLRFAADKAGRNLAPGDYADTDTSAFVPGHPLLDLYGDGRGGQDYVGSFSIRELEVDYSIQPYTLVRFSASFEERFSNGALAFRGVVSFNGNGNAADQIIEEANDGNDTAQSSLSYVLPVNVENLALTGGNPIDGTGNAAANALTGNAANNRLNGMEGDDTVEGGDGFDTLIGGDGDDSLSGMNQGDRIFGGNGNDFLGGGKGLDILDGGEGNDTFVGGMGSDTLIGGNGIDTADYSGAAEALAIDLNLAGAQVASPLQATESLASIEYLLGGTFNDLFTGNALNNMLSGNAGNDTLAGGDGFDTLEGGDGDDNLSGMNQGDVINGGNGNDFLGGGKGLDVLNGGEGDDTLQGGLGTDTLTGGNGADQFVFSTALDGTVNVDTITDFTSGSDVIQLSATTFTAFTAQVGQKIGLGPNLTYNPVTGALAYDADGAGAGAAINFALLGTTTHPAGLGADFLIVA